MADRTCSDCKHVAVPLGYGACRGCYALDPTRPHWEPEVEAVLAGRRKANASGQNGEDAEQIRAAVRSRNAGVQPSAQARADAYTGWFLYGAEVQALVPRIDAAIQRIVNGQGCMRIPADPEDPDLVLADCKKLLKRITTDAGVDTSDGGQKR